MASSDNPASAPLPPTQTDLPAVAPPPPLQPDLHALVPPPPPQPDLPALAPPQLDLPALPPPPLQLDIPAVPPPLQPQEEQRDESPPLVIGDLPAPDRSTEILRLYIEGLRKVEQAGAAVDQEQTPLDDPLEWPEDSLKLTETYYNACDELLELVDELKGFDTITVTNYSEYYVTLKMVDLPLDRKIWVHEMTSPECVANIKRRRAQQGDKTRMLIASELTVEELAGNREELFNSKNPLYSSESSDFIEPDSDGSSLGYYYSNSDAD